MLVCSKICICAQKLITCHRFLKLEDFANVFLKSGRAYILGDKSLAIFSIHFFFMIKYANVFDMRFIGRVLHNLTFHDNFARFSYVHVLPRDVEEIMRITCPAFHVHPMSSKFALTDAYMYQNNKTGVKFENFMMGRCPDTTLSKCKIVIGMLTAGMMNKKIVRRFQACESTKFSLRTKIRQWPVSKIENHADRSRKTTGREDIYRQCDVIQT